MNQTIYLLYFFVSISGISCASFTKTSFENTLESRAPTMLSTSSEDWIVSEKLEILKDKEDVLSALNSGKVVASKVIWSKDKKPVCFMNVKEDITPDFIYPIPESVSSQIHFKEDFPSCGQKKRDMLATLSQKFVPKGTQVALWPQIALAAGASAVIGCLFVISDEGVGNLEAGGYGVMTGAMAGGLWSAIKGNPLSAIAGSGLGMIIGFPASYLGYMICENATYLFESVD